MFVVVQTGSHLPPIRNNVFCSANCFQAIKNLIFCRESCDFWASVCLAVALSAWKCLLRAGSVRLVVSPKIALGSVLPPCRDKKSSKSIFGCYSVGNFFASAHFLVFHSLGSKDRARRARTSERAYGEMPAEHFDIIDIITLVH